MNAAALRAPLRSFTEGGERFTVIDLTEPELAGLAETADDLGMPKAVYGIGMPGFRGWNVFDGEGQHIGRVLARGAVMTAEWYDHIEQNEWITAEWGCRRLERAVYQIALIRDQTVRVYRQRKTQEDRARAAQTYLDYLAQHGLALDEYGDEVPAAAPQAVSELDAMRQARTPQRHRFAA